MFDILGLNVAVIGSPAYRAQIVHILRLDFQRKTTFPLFLDGLASFQAPPTSSLHTILLLCPAPSSLREASELLRVAVSSQSQRDLSECALAGRLPAASQVTHALPPPSPPPLLLSGQVAGGQITNLNALR